MLISEVEVGRPGYTLIELLVVLGIMAGLLAASVPRLAVLQREVQLNDAAQTIEQAVNSATALASAPSQFTDADKSQVNGGIQDANLNFAGHQYHGTVLLFSASSTATKLDTLSIREWQEPADPNTAASPPPTFNDQNNPPQTYYPEVKTIRLPNLTYIDAASGFYKTYDKNGATYDLTKLNSWPGDVPATAFTAFAYKDNGRPSLTLYLTENGYRDPPALAGNPKINTTMPLFLRLKVKRDNYTNSCRIVTVWLTHPGVSTETPAASVCNGTT